MSRILVLGGILLATVAFAGSEERTGVSECPDVAVPGESSVQAPTVYTFPEPRPYHRDSGKLDNRAKSPRILHRESVSIDGAAWLRVYFGDVVLEPGSFLRITSKLDGEVQQLDAAALEMWSNASGYFNGDEIDVELFGGPETTANRLVIEKLNWEEYDLLGGGCAGYCAICDGNDNRVPSNKKWVARIAGPICTASMYSEDSCFVSAGHCINPGGQQTLEFNVPPAGSGEPGEPICGAISHPPMDDQFPIVEVQYEPWGSPGDDWAVMIAGMNGRLETPYERYGELRRIASGNPSVGDTASVWGYGWDIDDCTRHYTQQTHSGPITHVGSEVFYQRVDMACGNSGSSIIRNGEILGIFTNCGCPSRSTRIDDPQFTAARNSICPQICGNGIKEGSEECDGSDIGDAACSDESCTAGPPSCNTDCTLDFSTCCCVGTTTPSWGHGSFKYPEAAYDGDEATYSTGSYGGKSPRTVSHIFRFTDFGTQSGQLRAVLSNSDPLGEDGLTTVEYSLDGVTFFLFGSKSDDTPAPFTVDLLDVDMGALEVRVTGSTAPSRAPAGQARVHEIDFTYDDDGDGDGLDEGDNCPCTYNPSQDDYDQDGIGGACDNCPFFYGSDQTDADGNGIGDICECDNNPATEIPYCDDGIECTYDKCYFELGNPIGMCKITSEGCD